MLDYSSTAEALAARIFALIPAQPQIMDMDSPWDLFKVPGFRCDDLGPSMAQAQHALRHAQATYSLALAAPEGPAQP